VVFLILESLGSTELLFILVMALVFFGPRKLPQISRSLGKNIAEFRRASEDFKRTWDREASLEDDTGAGNSALPGESSILDPQAASSSLPSPSVLTLAPDQAIARHTISSDAPNSSDKSDLTSDRSDFESVTDQPRHSPKNDWL
jgi:TatA/E family protein of Tat protein translocase